MISNIDLEEITCWM